MVVDRELKKNKYGELMENILAIQNQRDKYRQIQRQRKGNEEPSE